MIRLLKHYYDFFKYYFINIINMDSNIYQETLYRDI